MAGREVPIFGHCAIRSLVVTQLTAYEDVLPSK